MLTDTCPTCGLTVRFVRLVGRGFWEHETGGDHGHTAIAIGSMSGGLLDEHLNEAAKASEADVEGRARYHRLYAEWTHRVRRHEDES